MLRRSVLASMIVTLLAVPAVAGAATVSVTANITADTNWAPPDVYVLGQQVVVRDGATLTIAPGTLILADGDAGLIVATSGRISAVGTAAQPIVFSSSKPPGSQAPGDWRGVTLLGQAPINTNALAGPPSNQAALDQMPSLMFGGTDAADDCGTLRYVHIAYAGQIYVADRRGPGLRLAGCGSATQVDFVQVDRAAGDAFALFGGSVNLRHVVATDQRDDGFDWTDGWSGKSQFLISRVAEVPGAPDRPVGFEGDNHASAASYDALPRSSPTIYNATLVGTLFPGANPANFDAGMVLRRGTAGRINNTLVADFPAFGVEVRDPATASQIASTDLRIATTRFFQAPFPPPQVTGDIDEDAAFGPGAGLGNSLGGDPLLSAPHAAVPDFKPAAGSPVLAGGAAPPSDPFFDTSATFQGAIGATDWTVGWTAHPASTVRAPTLGTPAAIEGTPSVAQTLTCRQGTWNGYPDPVLSIQWLRDGAPIAGATSATFLIAAGDAGRTLTCRVSAASSAGTASADSASVVVAVPAATGLAAPSPGTSPAVSASAARKAVAKVAEGSLPKVASLLRAGTYRVVFPAPGAGTVTITWLARGKGSRASRGPVTLATGRATATGAGSLRVSVRLSQAGRRALRRAKRSVPITVRAAFEDSAGTVYRSSRAASLRR